MYEIQKNINNKVVKRTKMRYITVYKKQGGKQTKIMNIEQFNFDTNLSNKRKPTFYLKIAAIIFLSVVLVAVISLFIILKVGDKKKKSEAKEPFSQQIEQTLGSYYGYWFDLSYYGNPSILGEFLAPYYEGRTSLCIRGNVFGSAATFTIYPEAESLDENFAVNGVICESGIYIDTSHLGILKDPTTELYNEFGMPTFKSYYVRVADGMRGEDVTKSFLRILSFAEENGNASFGTTSDGLNAVEIKEISSDIPNIFSAFTNCKSKVAMSITVKEDSTDYTSEIKGDSDNFDFILSYHPDPEFRKRPDLKNTILSVEEYKTLMGEE